MRILVLSNFFPPDYVGGYELACEDTVRALAKTDTVVVLTRVRRWPTVSWRTNTTGTVILRLLVRPNSYRNWPGEALVRVLTQLWNAAIVRTIAKFGHFNGACVFNPSGLGALSLAALYSSTTVVHDVSDCDLAHQFTNDFWLSRNQAITQLITRLVTGNAMAPTAPQLRGAIFRSHFLRDQFARGNASIDGSVVIHHGVLVDKIRALPSGRAIDVLYAGRISPEKGLHVLLEALRNLAADEPINVVLIGPRTDAEYCATIEEQAARLSSASNVSVTVLGARPRAEIWGLMRRARVFVLPAIWDEPFSIAVLEAMAAGQVIVATSTGGTPEAIEHGRTGLLVPPGDSNALCAALRTVLFDEGHAQQLARASSARVDSFLLNESTSRFRSHVHALFESKADRC